MTLLRKYFTESNSHSQFRFKKQKLKGNTKVISTEIRAKQGSLLAKVVLERY